MFLSAVALQTLVFMASPAYVAFGEAPLNIALYLEFAVESTPIGMHTVSLYVPDESSAGIATLNHSQIYESRLALKVLADWLLKSHEEE
jgi:hypothetical protein